jgi:VIT1/CCC1 family predicted Fe2+/Mn2+ transporter
MNDDPKKSSKGVLDSQDRISEILFGLIMVLTFTGSLSVAEAGREDIRTMLIGALGCNIAWGIIDGVFYLMGCLADKSRNLMMYQAVRKAGSPQEAHQLIASALPPAVASILQPTELATIHERLLQLPIPPMRAQLNRTDWRGAAAVFLLVFLSTFPVAVPFIVMHDAMLALRISNGIAVVMLFLTGFGYGRSIDRSKWGFGFSMVVLGAALVALTMALGG